MQNILAQNNQESECSGTAAYETTNNIKSIKNLVINMWIENRSENVEMDELGTKECQL